MKRTAFILFIIAIMHLQAADTSIKQATDLLRKNKWPEVYTLIKEGKIAINPKLPCLPQPLHRAIETSHKDAITQLHQLGADLNLKSWRTPLMIACHGYLSGTIDFEIIRFLLDAGAHPACKNSLNQSCFDFVNLSKSEHKKELYAYLQGYVQDHAMQQSTDNQLPLASSIKKILAIQKTLEHLWNTAMPLVANGSVTQPTKNKLLKVAIDLGYENAVIALLAQDASQQTEVEQQIALQRLRNFENILNLLGTQVNITIPATSPYRISCGSVSFDLKDLEAVEQEPFTELVTENDKFVITFTNVNGQWMPHLFSQDSYEQMKAHAAPDAVENPLNRQKIKHTIPIIITRQNSQLSIAYDTYVASQGETD